VANLQRRRVAKCFQGFFSGSRNYLFDFIKKLTGAKHSLNAKIKLLKIHYFYLFIFSVLNILEKITFKNV